MRFGSEKRSLKAIRQGRREAYEQIICQHYESIYRLMAYLTGDTTLAEDLTQETFASAWATIDRFNEKASIKTWLHRIAYNKFIDSKRMSTRRTALLAACISADPDSDQAANPAEQSINDEHIAILYHALDELQLQDYAVIVLHYIGGFSFHETAAVLDKPVGTIKWQTSKALNELGRLLSDRMEQ
ncbi:MAG: RNA polymerase sigma factor [Sedimentisphaerales bacterium]|nr:RNA polymerase sigma factor [Sedimentisphaerales bacterium]